MSPPQPQLEHRVKTVFPARREIIVLSVRFLNQLDIFIFFCTPQMLKLLKERRNIIFPPIESDFVVGFFALEKVDNQHPNESKI